MSLLNDALQDLERSASRDNSIESALGTPSVPPARTRKRLLLPFAAATATVVWAVMVLGVPSGGAVERTASKLNVAHGTAKAAAAASPQPTALQIISKTTSAEPLPASERPSDEPAQPVGDAGSGNALAVQQEEVTGSELPAASQNSAIDALLRSAEQALAQDRLMTPVENNAYQLYRSVLLLEPASRAAHDGIGKIQQRYLELAESALQERKEKLAKLYLQRAEKTGASVERLQALRSALEAQVAAVPASPSAKANIHFDQDADLVQRLRAEPLAGNEAKAWLRIRSGKASTALVTALADAYAAAQARQPLSELLGVVDGREPHAVAYVQAQWLIINGDISGAAAWLTPYVGEQGLEHHLRLLAGVHAAKSDYTQALPLYRKLTQRPEFNLNDWLGFAVALERVGERQGALAAYTKIGRVRHTDGRINDYIQGRIRVLSADS